MKMGFKAELFVDPVDDSLKCDLCSGVYREPVVTSCGHVYCVGCLRDWLGNRDSCHRCCQQISLEKDVTRLLPLQKLVARLRTRCVYHGNGCEVVLAVDDMLDHMEACEFARKDGSSTVISFSDRVGCGPPEVGGLSQVLICKNGCGLPLLFQHDSTEHDCVKSLQAQVNSLQTRLSRSEHDKEKVSARLVKREECMQERFALLERELRSYQEQTLNYERLTRDQRSQINYLRRQLDHRGGDQAAEASEVTIVLERHGGTLGFNIRGGTEDDDGRCGIYVSKIVENTPASQPGKLQLYDRILQIDNVDLRNATHQEAVRAFKNSGDSIDISVRRFTNDNTRDMLSSPTLVSVGVQTEAMEAHDTRAQVTCCRCNSSNRSSQEFPSTNGINSMHQREDSGVDETGEHPSDIELHNGCDAIEPRTSSCGQSNEYPCDEILNKLLINTSFAALDKRTSRTLPQDANTGGCEAEDNAELHSLSNGYYSGNVSQASLENVKQGMVENRNDRGESLRHEVTEEELEASAALDESHGYVRLNENDQLYFDSELEYEYEEITIGMCGRRSLGMKLFSGDGEDMNSVFVNEVDPRSVVGKDGRVIEGDQILKINDVAVTCLEDAVELLGEKRKEIKFLVARPVAELQATLLGAESDHGETFADQSSRYRLEAFPIGVIKEEDEDEADTIIGDKCEKDSGVGRTDESMKNDESSEQDVVDEQHHLGTAKEQHKAQMDALGQQIIHFTACASNARELGLRDSPREKSSDEHSQRSGEKEKRESKSSKHGSRRPGNKTSSDENTHSSGHERKSGNKSHKSHKSTSRNSEGNVSVSRSKERSESKEKDRSEHRRKKDKSKDTGDSSRLTNGSRAHKEDRDISRARKQNGEQSTNENGDMKVQWRVRRNKDGSRIFISKKMRPAKQKLLRERAQKLAEERRGLTTDDETQSVYLGRYWSREDRRRQLDKLRNAQQAKKVEIDAEKKLNGHSAKRNDFAIIELTQKKMACVDQTFDDFLTVDEVLRQRNRLGLSNGPVFVTTV